MKIENKNNRSFQHELKIL